MTPFVFCVCIQVLLAPTVPTRYQTWLELLGLGERDVAGKLAGSDESARRESLWPLMRLTNSLCIPSSLCLMCIFPTIDWCNDLSCAGTSIVKSDCLKALLVCGASWSGFGSLSRSFSFSPARLLAETPT
jgi:hypothetical protein